MLTGWLGLVVEGPGWVRLGFVVGARGSGRLARPARLVRAGRAAPSSSGRGWLGLVVAGQGAHERRLEGPVRREGSRRPRLGFVVEAPGSARLAGSRRLRGELVVEARGALRLVRPAWLAPSRAGRGSARLVLVVEARGSARRELVRPAWLVPSRAAPGSARRELVVEARGWLGLVVEARGWHELPASARHGPGATSPLSRLGELTSK